MSAPATVRGAFSAGAAALAAADIPEARLTAELLLCHLLVVDRAHLYAHPERPLSPAQAKRWQALLGRALRHEPLAYIVHRREFYGLDFYVDRRVLIPRPETELLVEAALSWAGEFAVARGRPPLVADIGTGSGAIVVSLAVHLPSAHFYAVDVSPGALRVAERNARGHDVRGRIAFLAGDLLWPLPEPVDLVCANLPYVTAAEMAGLPAHIADHEPTLALAGGKDGLDLYRRLLAQVSDRILPGGALLLEIGYTQGEAARSLAQLALPGAGLEVVADLAGLPRLLKVRLPGPPPGEG
ncbi:MAG: peptide chain release factor N(5)-glutamine methyltransferase [Chloroflexota bacterium]